MPAPTNLLFISLDTTRADHLGVYGYERDTTPIIDALAANGAVFERAVAQMTITNPSHASMMTGLYPHTHGVGENTRKLPEEFVTLAEVLKTRGYDTAAFVSGHPLRREITGLTQGFDLYDSKFKRRRWGRETTDEALTWLRSRRRDSPFFAFVHYYDSHGPYRPTPPFRDRFRSEGKVGKTVDFVPDYQRLKKEDGRIIRDLAEYIDRYDEQIASQDALVGELLAEIDLTETLVVIVSDHGETFGERGEAFNLNHGTGVFDEQISIPMILVGPGIAAARHQVLAETVDLFPTLLELLFGSDPASSLPEVRAAQGRSLARVSRGEVDMAAGRERDSDPAFASNRTRPRMYEARNLDLQKGEFIEAVKRDHYKLVRYPAVNGPVLELYDLSVDPEESEDISMKHLEIRDSLLADLRRWSRQIEATPDRELSDEERIQLEALGYVED